MQILDQNNKQTLKEKVKGKDIITNEELEWFQHISCQVAG